MKNVDDLIDALADDAEAVRPAPRPIFISGGWMAAILLYVIMFLSVVGLREDIADVMAEPLFLIELLAVFATITSTAVAASLGATPDRARSPLATWAPFIPLLVFLFIIGYNYMGHIDAPHAHDTGDVGCAGWICMLSLLPATALFLLLSRGICLYPRTAYGHAALAAAMTAYLVLRLEEAYVTPIHLIVMHILPMIALIVIAMFIARLKIFSPLMKHKK